VVLLISGSSNSSIRSSLPGVQRHMGML
jgi:hypothetical protein